MEARQYLVAYSALYGDENEALAVESAITKLLSKKSARNSSVTMTTTSIVTASRCITLCQCCKVGRAADVKPRRTEEADVNCSVCHEVYLICITSSRRANSIAITTPRGRHWAAGQTSLIISVNDVILWLPRQPETASLGEWQRITSRGRSWRLVRRAVIASRWSVWFRRGNCRQNGTGSNTASSITVRRDTIQLISVSSASDAQSHLSNNARTDKNLKVMKKESRRLWESRKSPPQVSECNPTVILQFWHSWNISVFYLFYKHLFITGKICLIDKFLPCKLTLWRLPLSYLK